MTGGGAKKQLSPAADLLFGSAAGSVGMLFQFPFDTVKVRLQSQPHGTKLFKGPLDCAVKGIKEGGLGNLYKGLSAPLVGAMIENSTLFLAFNHIQGMIRQYSDTPDDMPLTMKQLAFSGFMSGAVVSFILTPVELVKCQLQVQDVLFTHQGAVPIHPHLSSSILPPSSPASQQRPITTAAAVSAIPVYAYTSQSHPQSPTRSQRRGPMGVILNTLRTHGLRGFYHGHVGTFLREAGGGAAWFGTYEFVVRQFLIRAERARLAHSSTAASPTTTSLPALKKEDLPTSQIMIAGAIAGMSYNGILFPADCVKSRQQTMEGGSSFLQVAKKLYRAEGYHGFYRGFGITVARSAPTSAMIFATYELLARHAAF
ncbi:mitochondrial carrier [Fimicolochytrium jonesii]|uniref:mitochondrial carrier n=1 Tax=Fimicolochytrium jonesii TaxID=1396493 RepID=UPI0022FE0863|nr:mitochondrial carrier [Fimicolochytrium jonesii]KAI8818802.1 mitochondrial carrier [Fimicolochytrium jonesii]